MRSQRWPYCCAPTPQPPLLPQLKVRCCCHCVRVHGCRRGRNNPLCSRRGSRGGSDSGLRRRRHPHEVQWLRGHTPQAGGPAPPASALRVPPPMRLCLRLLLPCRRLHCAPRQPQWHDVSGGQRPAHLGATQARGGRGYGGLRRCRRGGVGRGERTC